MSGWKVANVRYWDKTPCVNGMLSSVLVPERQPQEESAIVDIGENFASHGLRTCGEPHAISSDPANSTLACGGPTHNK